MREKAKEGFDFFIGRGYSPAAAAGIMGNFVGESRLNTSALNPGDGSDGSDSIGIGQWNSGRAKNLALFARANGLNPRDYRTQLEFTDWELNKTHQGAAEALRAARTPTEAAAAFVTKFEIPKGSNRGAEHAHGWGTRNAHANAIFKAFGEASDAPATGAPAGARWPVDRPAAGGFEVLDDAPAPAAPAVQNAGFVPPADAAPRMAGQPAPAGFELLDDEPPAPRLGAPSSTGGASGSRVRVTLPNAVGPTEEERQRAERVAQYEREARGFRETQNPIAREADTLVRGVARAVPFMDDIAAGLDVATGEAPSYQAGLDRQRAMNRVDDADRPAQSYGSQIAGGVVLPGGALASSGIKGAATVGAGYGALYGAGQGDGIDDRANRAVTGAALGGALGAGASAALTGAGMAGRAAMSAAGRPVGIARGALDPEAEAARRISVAMQKDAGLPGAQADAQMFAAARQAGQPVMLADEGGETVRALARSSANTSPEGRSALQGAVANRNAGQGERVADFIGGLMQASGDTTARRESLQAAARAANRPAYARAYAEGAGGLWDEGLQDLTAAPAVQQAIAKASRTGANRAVADGFRPPVSPFVRNADGAFALRQTERGEIAYPSLQFWDHVKRNLDDAHTVAQRQGRNAEAADIDALRKGLLSRLDEAAPSYAAARAGAARAFGAQDAIEAGEKFVGSNMPAPDARRAKAALSAPEKTLFEDSYANALVSRVRGLTDRADVVNRIFASPRAREEIDIALGREKASKLEAFLRVENVMSMTGRAVQGNSTTARQLMELGLAGGAGAAGQGVFTGDYSAGNIGLGVIMGNLARKGALKVDERVARRVGEMLASTDPETVRKATDQVARQPAFMRAIKGAEEWLSANLPKVVQPEAPAVDVLGAPRQLLGPAGGFADQDEQR